MICFFLTILLIPVFDFVSAGEYDHLPEQAFYMVGPIEEAVAKADKLAEEHS